MTRFTTSFAALFLAITLGAGCALPTARPISASSLQQDPDWLYLAAVPAVEQVSREGCGAACLAMVLQYWGHEVSPEELERECVVPGIEGIRAASLRDAARRRGLSAYLFAGTVEDVEHELRRGRPVIVGLAHPRGDAYLSHFQVVVGLHPSRQDVAVLEPAVGHLMRDALVDFAVAWGRARNVMLVVFETETWIEPRLEAVEYAFTAPAPPRGSSR